MNDSMSDALINRIERLERSNRRLLQVLASLALVAVIAVSAAAAKVAATPDILEAKRFVLKGPDGKDRVVIGVNAEGMTEQSFLGADGKRMLCFVSSEDEGAFVALSAKGEEEPCLILRVEADGIPNIDMYEKGKETARLDLSLTKEGLPVMNFFDNGDKLRLQFILDANGVPLLTVRDKDGNVIETIPRGK